MTALIASNRRAKHDYFFEEHFEAGIVLEGWEVKSIRANRINLNESYVIIRQGAAWLLGSHISPLETASTHVNPDPTRTRKLLLHKAQLRKLIGKVEQRGYTIIPIDLHFSKGRVKVAIALAKGKAEHDKRAAVKTRDWDRQKSRILRSANKAG